MLPRLWARHADSNHGSALEAYENAIELLQRSAMLGLSFQQVLSSGSGLASECCHLCHSIWLLRKSSWISWKRSNHILVANPSIPGTLDELSTVHLNLHKGCRSFSCTRARCHSRCPTNITHRMSQEHEAAHYRRLNNEWAITLERVRMLDGFEDFPRSRSFSTLRQAGINGPVVILNASQSGCDALIWRFPESSMLHCRHHYCGRKEPSKRHTRLSGGYEWWS